MAVRAKKFAQRVSARQISYLRLDYDGLVSPAYRLLFFLQLTLEGITLRGS